MNHPNPLKTLLKKYWRNIYYIANNCKYYTKNGSTIIATKKFYSSISMIT